ncbi:MAG: response regulator, partial [Sulfitobacter sp.]|nr:response regulator [Sulfitobacter sp.]
MDSNDPLAAHLPAPTADRPLLGLTILVVEDSRFACEAIRLLCLRAGARIRRADCLRSARRHLRVYRPSVLMVDIGLPDGTGLSLIEELSTATPSVDVILGISGDPGLEDRVMSSGADGFLAKPILSAAKFQETLMALLPAERRLRGPRRVDDTPVVPDRIAYHDDISHIADVLEDAQSENTLDYVAQFLTGVARSAADDPLERAALQLAAKRAAGGTATS